MTEQYLKVPRAFWPDFVDNKNILDVPQRQPEMRNLRKHVLGDLPLWKNTILGQTYVIWGGREG
jgi:hypothetical protein